MFGRKTRKATTTTTATVNTVTYSASDNTPHGVSVRFAGSPLWVEPTVWQPTRSAAESIAASMRRDHPDWTVEVVRKVV